MKFMRKMSFLLIVTNPIVQRCIFLTNPIIYTILKKIDDDETIMKMCKQFGLQDMIERESETIDTQLGFWFEVGGRYARACLLFLVL